MGVEPPQQTPKRLSFAPLAAPVLIEGGVCHTYLLMEFQEMDPQRGIYQEAYSWSLELCMGFAQIEIFGQMESRFQNKVL